ncbi:MAG TPA: hypothetical protein VEW03_15170 [Longimicrobiaceae bacterium]|nr:hypothetical protein [Longimicrobiaceae bacterium]
MTRHGNAGESTFSTVRERYRQWADANPRPGSPSAIGFPEVSEGAVRLLALATALGLGTMLLALAVTSFVAARSWAEIDRGGPVVAYTLTAFFLAVAGAGCIVGTLNHLFNVLAKPPAHH